MCANDAKDRAVHAGRTVHVHALFDQVGDDLFDLRLARALLHYHYHGYPSSRFP